MSNRKGSYRRGVMLGSAINYSVIERVRCFLRQQNAPNPRVFCEVSPSLLIRGGAKRREGCFDSQVLRRSEELKTVTNFEKRWAWFFTLVGWQWEYWPKKHPFRKVRPDFRVAVPCRVCPGTHTLEIFLRRGVTCAEDFSSVWGLLQSLRRDANIGLDSPTQPAVFGNNPAITLLDTVHGGGKYGVLEIGVWLPDDWKAMWKAARALTCYSVAQPVGELGRGEL